MLMSFSYLVPFVERGLGTTLVLGIKTKMSAFIIALLIW